MFQLNVLDKEPDAVVDKDLIVNICNELSSSIRAVDTAMTREPVASEVFIRSLSTMEMYMSSTRLRPGISL